jgi:hypothetical protein
MRVRLDGAMKSILVACLAVALSGCWLLPQTRTVVKPQTVEVPKYIRAALPGNLVKACKYAEPDPACFREGHREFCDEQLLDMRLGYRKALGDCDDDKTELRALQGKP